MTTIDETIPPPRLRAIGGCITALIDGKDRDVFLDFREQMLRALDPSGPQETALAEVIVRRHWHLRWIPALEASVLTAPDPSYGDLSQLSLYELRLTRVLNEERDALSQLQAARRTA